MRNSLSSPKLLYVALLHLVLIVLLFFPDVYSRIEARLSNGIHQQKVSYFQGASATMLARQAGNATADTVYFLGDSTVQGLNTTRFAQPVLNLGIGFDQSSDIRLRLSQYPHLATAKNIHVLVGVNDLLRQDLAVAQAQYLQLMQALSKSDKVTFHQVLPVDTSILPAELLSDIEQLNAFIGQQVALADNFQLSPVPPALLNRRGELKSIYHIGDGLHLNSDGYEVIIEHLQGQL